MKLSETDLELIEIAFQATKKSKKYEEDDTGLVGCALLTHKGNIYTGVNLDFDCGIGFCAEHTAIASMITEGESEIKTIIALNSEGIIGAPCGRCRELIYQASEKNLETDVIIDKDKKVKLKELLPERWQEKWKD
jgi:cytidine deaminase